MTIPELILDLRGTRDLFDWQYQGATKSIRGSLKTGTAKASLDPLAAVCFIRTKKVFDDAHCADVCQALGLPPSECSDVLDASNNVLLKDGEESPDVYKEWLRRQLIFAVALQNRSVDFIRAC